MPRRKRVVLFVTGHLPYPPISGGRRREYELIRRLARRFDVRLCVVSKTPEEDLANAGVLEEWCSQVFVTPAVAAEAPRRPGPVPELVVRHSSDAATRHMARAASAEPVDLVHVEGFYLMHHVPTWCTVPIVLTDQNIEYSLWEQRVPRVHGRRDRERGLVQYAATLQWEIAAWRRGTRCIAVTEEDRATMLEADAELDVRVVPDGADHVLPGPVGPSVSRWTPTAGREPVLVYVGNFGYAPNVDAAQYLCSEILPRVRHQIPSAHLLLVGNAPPPEVVRLAGEAVTVTGRVPAVEPYLDAADIAVFPLREGGGVKVKVLEALARGKAVVTTTIGTQGLAGVRDAVEVHDAPRKFAAAVVQVLRDRTRRLQLEDAARRAVGSLPTWDEAASALASCYSDLTERMETLRMTDAPRRSVG